MGKAKRFNAYDGAVAEQRKVIQNYGQARQNLSIGSSFRAAPLSPPTAITAASLTASSSALTEPLLQTITTLTTATEPSTTDIDCSAGNIFKVTLDEDITFDFTNETASKYQLIHIIIIQDGTGGWAVTWPAALTATPTVASGASEQTDVILYTIDQGTTWNYVVGSAGASIAGANKQLSNLSNPVLNTDVDVNDNDFTNIANLRFGTSGQLNPTEPNIYADASGDMVHNVATSDLFFWTVNDVVIGRLSDNELEIRTTTADGPDLVLRNNDQTPLDDDVVGQIFFKGNDDALASQNFGSIEFEQNDVSAGALQGSFKVNCQSDNSLQTIIDFSGSDAVFRLSSGVDVFRPNRDDGIAFGSASQSWADSYFANFLEIKEMSAPGNPPANSGRLYVADSGGTTTLYFKDSAGTATNILTGGGATTALDNLASVAINQSLISDTNNTDDLGSASIKWRDIFLDGNIRFGTNGGAEATESTIWTDASGDMVFNVATADQFFWTVNGTTEMTLDASTLQMNGVDLDLNSNELQFAASGTSLQHTGGAIISLFSSTEVFRYNASSFRLAQKLDMQDNEIILDEMSAAPTGISNAAIIYAEDNGSGKTRLMVEFPTGAAQQIAIEP